MRKIARFSLFGVKEMRRALRELSDEIRTDVASRVVEQAAIPIRDAAIRYAPRNTGELADSITISVRPNEPTGPYGDGANARIGPAEGAYRLLAAPIPYAARGVRAGRMRTYQIGSRVDVRAIFVEFGASDRPAQPFLRPAFDQYADTSLRIIRAELKSEIQRAAVSAARKAGVK